jgi:polysaccharide pyruvyl transferase CsaB
MRICQFAFIGSDNLGDEAIFETIHRDLQTLHPAQITILSMNPARTAAIASAENTSVRDARSVRDTFQAIRESDVLVCGGGGLFQDQTSLYNPSRYLSRIQLAHTLGKKVFVYGVSVGPLRQPLNRRLTGEILRKAACITVRDSPSKADLVAMGVPAGVVHVTSDPVMNFSGAACEDVARSGRIIVCLRHWFDTIDWLPVSVVNRFHIRSSTNERKYQRFVRAMAEILDHIVQTRASELVFLPFWGDRDTRVHREVLERMNNRTGCVVVEHSPSPTEANELIRSADFLVGMRLHSLILAAANCRPFFALDYSKKVGDFVESLLPGQRAIVSESPEDIDPHTTKGKLDRVFSNSPFGANYRAAVAELKRREKTNLELVKSELERRSPAS